MVVDSASSENSETLRKNMCLEKKGGEEAHIPAHLIHTVKWNQNKMPNVSRDVGKQNRQTLREECKMPWKTVWQLSHKLNINSSPNSASSHLPKRNKNICFRKTYKRMWVSLLFRIHKNLKQLSNNMSVNKIR